MPPKQATLGKFFGHQNEIRRAGSMRAESTFPSQAKSKDLSLLGKDDEQRDGNAFEVDGRDSENDLGSADKLTLVDLKSSVRGYANPIEKPLGLRQSSNKTSPKSTLKRSAFSGDGEMPQDEPKFKRKRLQRGNKSEASRKEAFVETRTFPALESPDSKSQTEDTSSKSERLSYSSEKSQKDSSDRNTFGYRALGTGASSSSSNKQRESPSRETPANGHDINGGQSFKDETIDTDLLDKLFTANDQHEVCEPDESEQEDDAESEDDKPVAFAKAMQQIQTTLISKTKDPYPDWEPGEPVPYAALCTTFSKIEMTSKRLEISAHCSLFLRQVLRLTPEDLLPTIQLMINKLAAEYTGIELGIGESLIMKAIGESTGRSLQIIKADQREIGDLGLVAAKSRSNQPTMFKPKPLTVRGVHEGLMAIATVEGQGSQARKIGGIKKLLSAADAHLASKGNKGFDISKDKGGPSEAKFIIRTLEGKMRLGLAEKTALVALAQAMVFHETSSRSDQMPSTGLLIKGETVLKSVFNELPSYEIVIPAMLQHGIFNLRSTCNLRPGVPLKPMLAKPTKSITEVLDRFEGKHFSCEYKYDGERAQIHFVAHDSTIENANTITHSCKNDEGVSHIFSRNSEDLSKKYPDVLEKLPTWVRVGTKSFVLDCETVAWDLEGKTVLPFQQLMTRKRKDVRAEDVKVRVCVFAFDILFLNGETLVNKSFRERRELLHSAFVEVESEFAFAKFGNTSELDEIQILLEESVKASCEGLMVKMLDGPESFYEPSRRSQNWLKVKKDYLAGMGDSLDLVVLGAYFGKGKRTSVYGAFLLACYNANQQIFETVCNIGTGFSEVVLEELHSQLEPIIIEREKPFYAHSTGNKDQPDVWFEAKYVWEVKAADLTISPRYRAAAAEMDGNKGISLRFPRFLKVREDKRPEEATSSQSVAAMYKSQEGVGKNKGPSVDDDFEY